MPSVENNGEDDFDMSKLFPDATNQEEVDPKKREELAQRVGELIKNQNPFTKLSDQINLELEKEARKILRLDKFTQIVSRCKAGVHLTANEHRDYYESVESYLSRPYVNEENIIGEIDPEKDLWNLHFYPHTPISFYSLYGNNLDTLFDKALQLLNEEGV
jgi:hypothetical protein